MKVLLEREPIVVPEIQSELDPELDKLADEAYMKAGYYRLRNKINEKTGREVVPFAKVLRKLDIRPFTLESVVKYKAWRLVKQFEETGREWWWQQSSLSGFQGDIPEFVIRKTIQITEGLHKAGVYNSGVLQVEYLIDQANNLADPFLVAVFGPSRCYVEVFEEAAFEADFLRNG